MKSTVKEPRNVKSISRGIERICAHSVEWELDDRDIPLSDMGVEHIQNMLIENYTAGELCIISPDGRTVWGWWNIQL